MATLPPPEGMSEMDYEAIEAAVTETARGRWFLNEFARRNRSAELRQLLDAMGRLEGAISSGHSNLPPADPSVRLLMQRIKDIAGQLDMLSLDMREAGVDERFAAAVEKEARAVSGMLRGSVLPKVPPAVAALPRAAPSAPTAPLLAAKPPEPRPSVVSMPEPSLPEPSPRAVRPSPAAAVASDDPRLAVLSGLDELSLAEKLALFA